MGKCSDKNKFETLFYSSRSVSDLARQLGYKLKDGKVPGGVSQIVNRYLDEYQLDKNFLLGQKWAKGKTRESDPILERRAIRLELPWDKAFAFGSKVHNQRLLKRLIRAEKKKYKCERCKIYEWREEPLVLELHHMNGIHHDNREVNLQILCPNCHSQVERLNEKAKRIKKAEKHAVAIKPIRKCHNCNEPISQWSKKGRCVKCSQVYQRKTTRPPKKALERMIKEKSWTALGKEFGVSDNAVRKWAKNYGIAI